jgi:hypothetical protein
MFLKGKCDHTIAGWRRKMHILLAVADDDREGWKWSGRTRWISFLTRIQKGTIATDFHGSNKDWSLVSKLAAEIS